MERPVRKTLAVLCAATALLAASPLSAKQLPSPVTANRDGKLSYLEFERGDRVPDFSHAGYRGGGVAIPHVPTQARVAAGERDATLSIQHAIDAVSKREPDANGHRGAVLLGPGVYKIGGQLKITASGVVLRGAGSGDNGTTLVAVGTGRRPLIELAGNDRRRSLGEAASVQDEYVPVAAVTLRLDRVENFKVGTKVTIERPSPLEWIKAVGMDDSPGRQNYQWKADTVNVRWDRVVTAVDGNNVTLDVPLTASLDSKYGRVTVTPYVQEGYLSEVGVENLRVVSEFDSSNLKDEQHAWNGIDVHAVRDGWVSNIVARHFAGSAIQVGAKAERITVQDCTSLEPVSEDAGYRRMSFHSRGQQVLFLRCRSESARNDFTVGYLTAGPTVFLDCEAIGSSSFSGSVGSWSSGLLFDSVSIDGGSLRLDNLETFNQGVGWAAANSMLWNSSAAVVVSRQPPGANNWAVAVWGQFVGDGRWSAVNEFAQPRSLYRAQLAARLGERALAALDPRTFPAEPFQGTQSLHGMDLMEPADKRLSLRNGKLLIDGQPIRGEQTQVSWWRGRLEPARASEIGIALTRFAPGRTGTGLTDEPKAIAESMVRKGQVALRHHYGLWYDRRRDDHQMIRRPDGDVWPPLFEQPFARSGKGKAWDGLSRYDLTKYNPWYFARLKEFAREARHHGLVLINEMYFQHNILESAGHWVDSPWRTVNNINETGFTEPPPFTGDTIKMAAEFYDVSHPVRRGLHRAYIRQCLANLSDEPNVIHTLSAENSGPLHFMQFWLDVIAEWEKETGKSPLIALSAPKDVQDAILADPVRAPLIDIIELKYWFRDAQGREFAPAGGTQLAPRQHLRLWKGGRPTKESIAAMVREYREKYPDKAVIADGNWGTE